ncbi:hypothetical protein [Streptomyces sp. NPDC092952]|uniref:hypothetical protein n=1 Tax=Streptomyces sp. NPDC092952 TaxID=3366018 RepID=UPI0038072134
MDALLLHCAHRWAHSGGATHTSLRKLERATDCDAADLRDTLRRLDTAGEIQLYCGRPQTLAGAADLATHANFVIVADWPRININRPRSGRRRNGTPLGTASPPPESRPSSRSR